MTDVRSFLRVLPLVLVLVLALALVWARVHLAHSLNVHWDEFYFLSKIYSHGRGQLSEKLLTFHVHLLGWVRGTSGDEVMQALRIREVMLVLGGIAAGATFFIGRRLLGSVVGAAFAVLAGQSVSLVLNHGASARYDPIVVACLLGAGALLVSERRWAAPLAGVVTAFGMLISIKSALYLPTLAGLVLCRVVWGNDARAAWRDGVAFAVAALVVFVPLFAWHATTLATGAAATTAGPSGVGALLLQVLAKVVVLELGLQNSKAFFATLRWDWGFWVLLSLGAATAIVALWRGPREQRQRHAQLLCFALPLAALLFYRNSFPYFYVTILPPAALLVGLVVARLERRLAHRPLVWAAVALVVAAPMAQSAFAWTAYNGGDQLAAQRSIVAAVHEMFPTPVPYVDRCAMIGSFEKVGPFMSTWTLSEYRQRGAPVMRELLRSKRPQFVLQNVTSLDLQGGFKAGREFHRLLREDFLTLRENFIPHWGPIWVAGKTMTLARDGTPRDVEVLIAGPYVVESEGAVLHDGQRVLPGAVLELSEGHHQFATDAAAPATRVTLRAASAGPPPATAPPRGRIFEGFRSRTQPLPQAGDEGADDPTAP